MLFPSIFLCNGIILKGLFNCCYPACPSFLPLFPHNHPLSSPIFHGCVNEHLADRTPSPTFSTTDSEITEMADERQSEMSDLMDDEAFVDDTSSDAGTEEGSDIFSDGQDPFYDRSPWFILVGRLVTSSVDLLAFMLEAQSAQAKRQSIGK